MSDLEVWDGNPPGFIRAVMCCYIGLIVKDSLL